MEAAVVFIVMFVVIFGVFYLYYSTRNKERLALIEKGADASIFFSKKDKKTAPVWKILILNVALLLIGIGAGIFLASYLHYNLGVDDDVAFPGAIFLISGIFLFIGFLSTKKLIEKE